jgi:hypothetical protein
MHSPCCRDNVESSFSRTTDPPIIVVTSNISILRSDLSRAGVGLHRTLPLIAI